MYARYKAKRSKGVYSLGSKQSVEQTDLWTDGYTSHSNQETIHGKNTTDEVVSNDFYIKMQIFLNEKNNRNTPMDGWMHACKQATEQVRKVPHHMDTMMIVWVQTFFWMF